MQDFWQQLLLCLFPPKILIPYLFSPHTLPNKKAFLLGLLSIYILLLVHVFLSVGVTVNFSLCGFRNKAGTFILPPPSLSYQLVSLLHLSS